MNTFNNKENARGKNIHTKKDNTQKKPLKVKPKYVKLRVEIADSDFYASNLDSLYNLLCSIPFNKVAIPVHMNKSEMFGNNKLKGTAVYGTVESFNNDNSFTISVQENFANKLTDAHVLSIRCKKNYETGEITYVSSFCVIKGNSVKNHYDDVEQAMLDAADNYDVNDKNASEQSID